MKASHRITPVFDDPNLVGCAGLVPVMRLAEEAGLHDLIGEHLTVDSPNPVAKTSSVVAGMMAGADSIDDLDVLRHGAMPKLFTGIRAPSTLGTFLRSFTHGHVKQLGAVASRFLAGLANRVPGLLAGGTDTGGLVFLDLDDTVREVHGYSKQAAAYGYTGVYGLNAMIAAVSSLLAAPVIAAASLRRGNTASATGCADMLARAVATIRRAGVISPVLARADSAFYRCDLVKACRRVKIWFSITARVNPAVKRAIASIPADAWVTIKYPQAAWDDELQAWISNAEVAEVEFTAFTGRPRRDQVTCRLIVRRVKRHQPLAGDGTAQGELFATYRHHAFITNSPLELVQADQVHRGHAIIEQVIAELKDGPLAHLPSGKYAANAAWLACAVIAFNLARAASHLASQRHTNARWATLRTQLINIPARLASTGRRLILHLPTD